MTRKEPPCICVWRRPREGEGGQRGMLCKQPGFIISSQVTFTEGWRVFRRDRDTDRDTVITDGGEADGKGELICGVWRLGQLLGGGDLGATAFRS